MYDEVITKEHPWFSPIDDAATNMARHWLDTMNEDDDSVFEIIEDGAVEVGIGAIDIRDFERDGPAWAEHERFERECVKRGRLKLIEMLAHELGDTE